MYPESFGIKKEESKPKQDTSGFKAAASAGATRLGGEFELLKGKLGVKSEDEAQKEYEAAQKRAQERFTPTEKGFTEEVEKCIYRSGKLNEGLEVMHRGVTVPKDRIGAFVGHYPMMLTHPDLDRFITYREAMTIMGLPSDFELIKPNTKSRNHICQNVPVQTAADMATEVLSVLNGKRTMLDVDYVLQNNATQTEEYFVEQNTLDQFFI
jgi:site-specific DNA-cytosine methylase